MSFLFWFNYRHWGHYLEVCFYIKNINALKIHFNGIQNPKLSLEWKGRKR